MKKRIDWKVLIICFVIVFLMAFIGSIFTSQNTNSEWYQEIKPSLTPPNWVFPIVWNILFILIAFSLYFVLISSKKKDGIKIIIVFGINLILNATWSYLYFGLKNPLLAFLELILIWISIILMISVSYKINKKASYLLIPYLLWVSFAGILNYLSII